MIAEISVQQARRTFSPGEMGIKCTDEVQPLDGIIGQQRALAAIRFGLGMPEDGYNIFVSGLPGTGKTAAVKAYLEAEAAKKTSPPDWCYVHNFQDPSRSKALQLPCGMGRELQKDMKRLVERAQKDVTAAFESEAYRQKREAVQEGGRRRKEATIEALNQEAQQEGLAIQATPMGIFIIPAIGGKPASEEEIARLPHKQREALEKARQSVEAKVRAALAEFRTLEKSANEMLEELDHQACSYAIGHLVDELGEKYKDVPQVSDYLRGVRADMVENVEQWRPQPPAAAPGFVPPWVAEQALRKYRVNLLVDNTQCRGAPVVLEFNPTYNNLFGRLERESQFGALSTDFTLIRPGALHRANGGYLVIRVEDLLRSPFAWDGLKRCLREGKIEIEEVGERFGIPIIKTLIPEPVPLRVKIVLLGPPLVYYLLQAYEPEFNEWFRVRADFDSSMEITPENVKHYVSFLCMQCKNRGLRHLDGAGVAKVLEYAARLTEHQEKLSTRFAIVTEIVQEANYWAGQEAAKLISAHHVQKAIEQKVYRSNLIQERIIEMIQRGSFLIETDSEAVGQVNGLAVIGLGDFSFGRPSRITASVAPGREGLMDVEREAKLGGRIHTKGVMIIGGYLANTFAGKTPLSLSARLAFEQSYEEVDGDSASSAELYALLSRLANLPLRQGIAVTGAVDQKGRVQAIGGVNQKIEGFYDVCKVKGLTGKQGVAIPASNVQNLMLREDVAEAVRAGQFHVWAVSTIDEGIEILTGVKAGAKLPDGAFEKDTVNSRVQQRLQELTKELRAAAAPEAPGKKAGEGGAESGNG